jgi:hypothetical protein
MFIQSFVPLLHVLPEHDDVWMFIGYFYGQLYVLILNLIIKFIIGNKKWFVLILLAIDDTLFSFSSDIDNK